MTKKGNFKIFDNIFFSFCGGSWDLKKMLGFINFLEELLEFFGSSGTLKFLKKKEEDIIGILTISQEQRQLEQF